MDTLIKTELPRKGVHVLGLLLIPILYYSPPLAIILCGLLIPIYLIEEYLFRSGYSLGGLLPFIQKCKRPHESLFAPSPIYLALGILFAMIFFPFPAAACGIIQVSIADAGAAIIGMKWGKKKLPGLLHKSWLGTLAFLTIAFLGSLLFFSYDKALILAVTGLGLEIISIRGLDNIIVPVGVGLVGMLLM